MTPDQQAHLTALTEDMEKGYQRFIEGEGVHDLPIIRAAFYCAAEIIILEDPYPDRTVQGALESYVHQNKLQAFGHKLRDIERHLMKVSEERVSST